MNDLPLMTTIAAAFTAAWILGLLTQRLGLSPIVGYLLAGVLIGPHTPGFMGDIRLAQQLAEVGVILLMFGVGLHFHIEDLLAVKNIAIPGAIGQSLAATILGVVAFALLGFSVKTGMVLGMAMAVASTVVLMRVLLDAHALESPAGHVAVGWLLVEDIFTVIVLVMIPVMGTGPEPSGDPTPMWAAVSWALLKLAVLVTLIMVAGSRVIPWILVRVTRLRSRELFTLTVLVFSIAIAVGSYQIFGASMALGAFLAGMVVARSPVGHQAAVDVLPMRDSFAVLFFVSVGMLFDPFFVIEEPLMILAALAIILVAKPITALAIVAALGHSSHIALTVALGLAQIGEFSFILSELAREHGLLPEAGHSVLVASAILTITLNPMLFRSMPQIEAWMRRRPRLWALLNSRSDRRAREANLQTTHGLTSVIANDSRLAVVVGYGPVGRAVDELLRQAGLTTVIIDLNLDTVSELNREGRTAIFGDAARDAILKQAGIQRASYLVLTLPHFNERTVIVSVSRNLNAKLKILVRARYLREKEGLEQAGATAVVYEEAEAGAALARLVLAELAAGEHPAIQRSRP